MTFEAGKTYETRDGREARVYATDGGGEYSIHGAIRQDDGSWESESWNAHGIYITVDDKVGPNDLTEKEAAPKPEPRRVRLAVYKPLNRDAWPDQDWIDCIEGPDGALRVV